MEHTMKRFITLIIYPLLFSIVFFHAKEVLAQSTTHKLFSEQDSVKYYFFLYQNPISLLFQEYSLYFEIQRSKSLSYGISVGYEGNKPSKLYLGTSDRYKIYRKSCDGPVLRAMAKYCLWNTKKDRINFCTLEASYYYLKSDVEKSYSIYGFAESTEQTYGQRLTVSSNIHFTGLALYLGRRNLKKFKNNKNDLISFMSEFYISIGYCWIYYIPYYTYNENLMDSEITGYSPQLGVLDKKYSYYSTTVQMGIRLGFYGCKKMHDR